MNGEIYRGIQVHEQRNIQKTQVDGQRIIQRNTGILIEEYIEKHRQMDRGIEKYIEKHSQMKSGIYKGTQVEEYRNIKRNTSK